MITLLSRCFAVILLLATTLHAQVPQLINYQGRVVVDGVNFDGAGQFKFALVNASGSTSYWSNDGSSVAGGEPTNAVTLAVSKGLYSVLLGDATLANMTIVPAIVFANGDVHLRVWFNDGVTGFQQLTPDRRIAAVGYAMMAESVVDGSISAAKIADGAMTTSKLANGAITTAKLADGAVTALKIADGAVTGLKIAGGAIGSLQMADGAVTTSKIGTGAVGGIHIASGAIGSSNIAPGAVTQAALAPGTIGLSQLAKPVQSGRITSFPNAYFGAGDLTTTFPVSFNSTPVVAVASVDVSSSSPAQLSLSSVTTSGFSGSFSTGTPPFFGTLDIDGNDISVSPVIISNGNPSCAVVEGDQILSFARASDSNGSVVPWSRSSAILVTSNQLSIPDAAIVSSNPALAFFESVKGLKFTRATNQDGSAWVPPIVIDSTITSVVNLYSYYITKQVSLAVVSGNPAVGYYDETNGNLKFVRATTATGTAWGTPLVVQSSGDVGAFPQLLVVSGNPAIAYYDVTARNVMFVRATDATGTTWGTPVIVCNGGGVGRSLSLGIVNGNPAATFYDVGTTDLKYVRANDVNGETWATPVTPDSAGDVGVYASLAVIDGNPAIAYHEDQLDDIKFVRANDANGGTWGRPLTIATEGFVGTHISLTMVNGRPAIRWINQSTEAAVFCRSILPTLTINWMAQEP
jgi:hypothetical protein